MTISDCKLRIANFRLKFTKRNSQLAFCILQFAILWCFVFSQNRAVVAQDVVPGWHTNLDDACRAAEANGKPLFIVFRCVR
jgi:hypothetical protein